MDLFDNYRREFIKELDQMAHRHNIVDVFGDVCSAMSSALCKATKFRKAEQDACEAEYMDVVGRYTKDELVHMPKMLAIVADALETRRESFLGPVLESIGAANTRNGQFLTPASVANMMACVNMCGYVHTKGRLITINDPACGAGVTLIAQGEMLLHEKHVPQRDIFIIGGDIDKRACDMTYIELTLLGYAARIDHMNELTMQRFSSPRYTLGYYLHGTQWRERRRDKSSVELRPSSDGKHSFVFNFQD